MKYCLLLYVCNCLLYQKCCNKCRLPEGNAHNIFHAVSDISLLFHQFQTMDITGNFPAAVAALVWALLLFPFSSFLFFSIVRMAVIVARKETLKLRGLEAWEFRSRHRNH